MQANTTDGPSEEPVDARVRRRLRELRMEQGLTLQQVSERAHIDVSTLSRLEAGKRRLALDHLPGLAAALGVSADELLSGPAAIDPRVHQDPIVRDGLTLWPLTNRTSVGGGLLAYKVVIEAERNVPPDPLPVHDGYDWMYVIRGNMRLLLGAEDLIIEPGEAVEFSTRTPHWFGAIDTSVELLGLFGAHGQKAHLHDWAAPAPT